MQERFVLATLGGTPHEPSVTFPIVDLEDTYHRVHAFATSWTQGQAMVEYLNRGSFDAGYWDQLAADLKTAPARGYRPCNEGYVDQLRRETAANGDES